MPTCIKRHATDKSLKDTPFTFVRASWQNKHQSHKVLSTLLRVRRPTVDSGSVLHTCGSRSTGECFPWLPWRLRLTSERDIDVDSCSPSAWSCSSSACSFPAQRVALPTCPVPACECTTGSTCDDTLHEAQRGQPRSRRGRKTVVRSLRRAVACRSDFQLLSVYNVSGSESDIDLSSSLWHRHEFQSSLANLAGRTEAARVPLCISQSSTRSHKTFKHGKTSRYIHFVYVVMVTTGPQRNRLVLRLVPGLSLPTNTARLRRSLSTQKITSCLV